MRSVVTFKLSQTSAKDSNQEAAADMTDQLEKARAKWDKLAERFTEWANKRVTMQSSQHLHSHMQLDLAHNVLEVAAGAGLGSVDIAQYLLEDRSKVPRETKRTFTVTDLSPVMVDMAAKNMSGISSECVQIKCSEANGQDLTNVKSGSVDRYISSYCLHLVPDPDALLREASRVLTADGIAGFSIWGSPERSGIIVISTAANKELGFEKNVVEHPDFAIGKDLPALRQRFAAAGFNQVLIWPFQCVVECWKSEEFAKFHEEMFLVEDEQLRAKRFAVVKRMSDEWLAKGTPIGLETYIILAKK